MKKAISVVACVALGVWLIGNQASSQTQTSRKSAALAALAASPFKLASVSQAGGPGSAGVLAPGRDDGAIARIVARILQDGHYSRKKLNDETSSLFLDRYLDALDPLRLCFIKSDMDDFERYRTTLDDALLAQGSTAAGNHIFARLLERVTQQTEFALDYLKNEKFEFTGTDTYAPERKDAPRPADLAEAKELWKARLRYEFLQEKLANAKPGDIVTTLSRRYERFLKSLKQYDSDDVLQLFLTSLARVYDPHSDYMGRAMFEDFGINMKLSLFGIGALLGTEDGYCEVKEITPGGPADQSKLIHAGDRIVGVAQGDGDYVDVIDMKLSRVVDMIRGEKGTVVRLKVIPAGADLATRKEIKLVRAEIKLEEQEAKAKVVEVPSAGGPKRIGVIDLPSFYEGGGRGGVPPKKASADVLRLINKLKQEKISGLVLDLRRNGGGSLGEAINLSGLFIKDGPVVQVRDSDGTSEEDRDPDPGIAYDGPMVVLTSRMSASASEILAGALQDYGRAVLVGDSSTHGKGTVQSLLPLGPYMRERGALAAGSDPGALKVTIQKFYRVSGASTQLKGVVPDVVLPSINSHLEIGEASLENPLPWDQIAPAKFKPLGWVNPYLDQIRKRSASRVAANPDFKFIETEGAKLEERRAIKAVSLNEDVRKKEREETLARVEARKKELKARKADTSRVALITLKGVDANVPLKFQASGVTASTTTRRKPVTEDDDEGLPTTGAVDAHLKEAESILLDLLSLSMKKN